MSSFFFSPFGLVSSDQVVQVYSYVGIGAYVARAAARVHSVFDPPSSGEIHGFGAIESVVETGMIRVRKRYYDFLRILRNLYKCNDEIEL